MDVPWTLNEMFTLQPLGAQEMLMPCSPLLISHHFTCFPQVAPPQAPSPLPIFPSIPYGTHLRPHWERLGAQERLAIPFYTCPIGLSQQNLKKEKNPSGLQWLGWPRFPRPDWMLPGPLGGISECSNSRTFPFLPWPLGKLMTSAQGCRLWVKIEQLANEFSS